MTEIYFATNRTASLTAQRGFGSDMSQLTSYGVAVMPPAPSSITIAPATNGRWSDSDIDSIVSADRDIVVFVHGFGYKFTDAIADAALYQSLLLAGGLGVTMLAFDFAETGVEVGFPWLSEPYFDSRQRAAASAAAMAAFLDQIAIIRFNLMSRHPGRRVTVLAHSMGNFLLAEAMAVYLAVGDRMIVADAFILAAADEQYDSFECAGPRLSALRYIISAGGQIVALISRHDEVLLLSDILNRRQRLGYNGPKCRMAGVQIIDCTPDDPIRPNPDETHQYYRIPEIVAQVASIVTGKAHSTID